MKISFIISLEFDILCLELDINLKFKIDSQKLESLSRSNLIQFDIGLSSILLKTFFELLP